MTMVSLSLDLPPRNGGINKPFCPISGRGEDQGFAGSRPAAVLGTRCPAGLFPAAPRLAASHLFV